MVGAAMPFRNMQLPFMFCQVALLAGCLYTAVGMLRLGWITNFLSHSVICGFMTGASVIIGLSQVTLLPLSQWQVAVTQQWDCCEH